MSVLHTVEITINDLQIFLNTIFTIVIPQKNFSPCPLQQ